MINNNKEISNHTLDENKKIATDDKNEESIEILSWDDFITLCQSDSTLLIQNTGTSALV